MIVDAKTLCHSYRCLGRRLGDPTYMLNVGSELREKEVIIRQKSITGRRLGQLTRSCQQ